VIALAEHSYLWVGVERVPGPDGTTVTAGEHMYVEYFVPQERTKPHPVILVHGGNGQGMAFLGPGGGEPGWAHHLLAEGYAVYLVDRPGLGRNPPLPYDGQAVAAVPYEAVTREFMFGAETGRWKGTGDIGDPRVDQVMAQQRGTPAGAPQPVELYKRRGGELLEAIGPAILIMHSAGGPFGWVTADARPELVKAIVSVEALPPAMAASQLTFDPPGELDLVAVPDERDVEWGPLGRVPRVVQADPPRRLANLSGIPIACLNSDDPRFSEINRVAAEFLRQAGCSVDDLVLADHGIRGNSHFMTLEENSREVLGVALAWVEEHVT
jgi:pimeloyl-ACP methyl ester carboxylesterase